MKKIMTVLSAMFLLACGMMMTGCELKEALENLVGPKDKWCEKEFTYESDGDDKTVSTVTCYMFYSEEGTDSTKNPKYKDGIVIEPGLTLIVVGDTTNETANIIGENKYVIKNLPKGKKITSEGELDEDNGFSMNELLWNLICTLGDSDIPESASNRIPDPIANNSTGAKYQELTDGSFNWSKIIKKILLQKVIDKLEEDTQE